MLCKEEKITSFFTQRGRGRLFDKIHARKGTLRTMQTRSHGLMNYYIAAHVIVRAILPFSIDRIFELIKKRYAQILVLYLGDNNVACKGQKYISFVF